RPLGLVTLTSTTPPRSTLFPYTTLFRSRIPSAMAEVISAQRCRWRRLSRQSPDRRPPRRACPALAGNADRCRRLQSRGSCRRLRSEEHTSELQSRENLVCRLLLEKRKQN